METREVGVRYDGRGEVGVWLSANWEAWQARMSIFANMSTLHDHEVY